MNVIWKMKKSIIVLISIAIVAVLIFPPYKIYTSIFFAATPDVKATIFGEITDIFSDGRWLHLPFLFILFPSVLILQIRNSGLTSRKKKIFIAEGITALLATYAMYYMMTWYFLESDIVLTFVFYLSLLWVLLGATASIFLAREKIYDEINRLLYR